jgi:hypothetical protein
MPQFACTSLMHSSFVEKLSIQLSGMDFSSINTAQGVDDCYAAARWCSGGFCSPHSKKFRGATVLTCLPCVEVLLVALRSS